MAAVGALVAIPVYYFLLTIDASVLNWILIAPLIQKLMHGVK